jgi:hypothetical protein
MVVSHCSDHVGYMTPSRLKTLTTFLYIFEPETNLAAIQFGY